MKRVIQTVAAGTPLTLDEIDVDSASDLRQQFGGEVPVLLINGRKAFKYTATVRELRKKLSRTAGIREALARKFLRRS
jgi:hypothetical protein